MHRFQNPAFSGSRKLLPDPLQPLQPRSQTHWAATGFPETLESQLSPSHVPTTLGHQQDTRVPSDHCLPALLPLHDPLPLPPTVPILALPGVLQTLLIHGEPLISPPEPAAPAEACAFLDTLPLCSSQERCSGPTQGTSCPYGAFVPVRKRLTCFKTSHVELWGNRNNRCNISSISDTLPERGAVHRTTSATARGGRVPVTRAQAGGLGAGLVSQCLHVHANPCPLEMQAGSWTASNAPALMSSPDLQPITFVKDFSTEFTVSLVMPQLSNNADGLCIPVNSSPKSIVTGNIRPYSLSAMCLPRPHLEPILYSERRHANVLSVQDVLSA